MPLRRRRIIGPSFPYLAVPYTAGGGGGTTSSNTWNSSDVGPFITLSPDKLTANTSNSSFQCFRAVDSASTGKFYWEVRTTGSANIFQGGIGNSSFSLGTYLGADNNAIGSDQAGNFYMNGGSVFFNSNIIQAIGDYACYAVDIIAQLIWLRVNGGPWNAGGTADPSTGLGGVSFATMAAGPYFAAGCINDTGETMTVNFGATPFNQAIPSLYGRWP